MALTVADSDVLIDALRGREPARARVAEAIRARRLATTVISVFERLPVVALDPAGTKKRSQPISNPTADG